MWIASISTEGKPLLTAFCRATLLQRRAAGDKVLGIVKTIEEAHGLLDDAEGRCSQQTHRRPGRGKHVCQDCQSDALVGGLTLSLRRAS